MRRIADLLTAGRRRINLKAVFKPCLTDQVGEDTLGHCAAADVAVADEKYFYLAHFISLYLLKAL